MHTQVLLINANYAPLAVVSLPRAMRLLARQKAEVLEADERAITTGTAGVTVARPLVRTNGGPTSGGDPVKSFGTIDLNLSYRLTEFAGLGETQLFVDTTNLTDKAPPQYNAFNTNGSAGYDNINASPIGRVITLGVRAKF